jgi:hypothetical protein
MSWPRRTAISLPDASVNVYGSCGRQSAWIVLFRLPPVTPICLKSSRIAARHSQPRCLRPPIRHLPPASVLASSAQARELVIPVPSSLTRKPRPGMHRRPVHAQLGSRYPSCYPRPIWP